MLRRINLFPRAGVKLPTDGSVVLVKATSKMSLNDVGEGAQIVVSLAFFLVDSASLLVCTVVVRESSKRSSYKEPPPQQLRSDWCSDECGFEVGRSSHAKLKTIPYYDVSHAAPVDLVSLVSKAAGECSIAVRRVLMCARAPRADITTVKLSNPFDSDIGGLEIAAHYEGGRGTRCLLT